MEVLASVLATLLVYLLLNIAFLSPFMLSARISRKEEEKPHIRH
jgi:hypothetical protein